MDPEGRGKLDRESFKAAARELLLAQHGSPSSQVQANDAAAAAPAAAAAIRMQQSSKRRLGDPEHNEAWRQLGREAALASLLKSPDHNIGIGAF
jgi:hypothetical protein